MGKPVTFGFAVPCFNEARNLAGLLPRLECVRVDGAGPKRIVVVSDASRDGTNEIAQRFAPASMAPTILLTNERRLGKASAVNRAIGEMADIDVIVLVSADVVPGDGCIEKLVGEFHDERVGVAGGRVIPFGPLRNATVRVTRLLWELHHCITTRYPKTTEITAFRNVIAGIDETSLVDEAELEARLKSRGFVTRYVPEAHILSPSPLTLADYLKRRTSITFGYLDLRRRHGYFVETQSLNERWRAIREVGWWRIGFETLFLAGMLEAIVWVGAHLRFAWGRPSDGIWSRAESTKQAAAAEEQNVPEMLCVLSRLS